MPISAQAVSSLRSRTGVSILECKKALDEANGDEEQAIEILRKRGIAQAAKKADREQAEGLVFLAQEGNKAAIVQLQCETDFVANDDNFRAFGQELAQTLLHEGEDALKAFVDQKLTDVVQKLGENISLGDYATVASDVLGTYIHTNSKIGVIVSLTQGDESLARDVAMHAAAMSPQYVAPENVSDEMVAKEKGIWKEQLAQEGKPEEIMEKIMLGKEKKFREENALISQPFVKDPSKTVGDHLNGAKVTEYVRIAVG